MAAFEYRQALEIRDAFQLHAVRYLFIGKSGAILSGYPDTTQESELFIEKSVVNCHPIRSGQRTRAGKGIGWSEPPVWDCAWPSARHHPLEAPRPIAC